MSGRACACRVVASAVAVGARESTLIEQAVFESVVR